MRVHLGLQTFSVLSAEAFGCGHIPGAFRSRLWRPLPRQEAFVKLDPVDAVVIGAGAAGGIVAEQLCLAGLRVALLERGHTQTYEETGHDELRSQRTTVLGNAFGPD